MGNVEKKKKKVVWQQYIVMGFFVIIGAVFGFFIAGYLDSVMAGDNNFNSEIFLSCGILFLGMYAAIFLQTVFHEAGHLIFGLLTGYQFSSFRIGDFMWVRESGKLCFKRLSIAGTGGQCLMTPPPMKNGKFPIALYNLGGSLMNIIVSFICLGLYFLCKSIPLLSAFLLMIMLVGFSLAIINGIPLKLGIVNNDGYNAFSLEKNPKALSSFWLQLKVNEQISKGIRLKDMPEEWFVLPSDEEMKDSMTSVIGVFACNRLIDEKRFTDAEKLIKHLLEIESGMVGLHRNLMICDLAYCELIGENRKEQLEKMLDKEQLKFMKSMKKFPTVLRTEYVYALLGENNTAKGEEIKTKFEKCAKTYPYPSEITGERELMQIAEQKQNKIEIK